MAKLTRDQRRRIEMALTSLNAALTYLESDRVAICMVGEINGAVPDTGTGEPGTEYRAAQAYRSQDYTGRDGAEWTIHWHRTLTPVNKGVGSNLAQAYTARKALQDLLEA